MKSYRENPDGEENQRATRQTEREVGGLKLAATLELGHARSEDAHCLACGFKITMKTPETTAGYLTENIMCRVRSKLPELPTHEYNRIYEAVLGELQCHVLPERQEASAQHSNAPGEPRSQ